MNHRRVAELHRDLAALERRRAELHEEIAIALTDEPVSNEPPKRAHVPVQPKIVPPLKPPSELDRARARRELGRIGYRVKR